jgi:HK97 family phage prohead protease
METRAISDKIEVRSDGGRTTISGYAAVFNSLSEDLGGFVEVIRPGAFQAALAAGQDVRGLVNHDPNLLLGRTASGTMRLAEDKRGLRYEIDAPDTQLARDLVELLRRGDLTGSSFAFTVAKDGDLWRDEQGNTIRELHAVDTLYDVGPVVYPAYKTTVSEAARRSLERFVRRNETEFDKAVRAQILSLDKLNRDIAMNNVRLSPETAKHSG